MQPGEQVWGNPAANTLTSQVQSQAGEGGLPVGATIQGVPATLTS